MTLAGDVDTTPWRADLPLPQTMHTAWNGMQKQRIANGVYHELMVQVQRKE